jgi:ornithine carbamoyltransferase
LWHSVERENTLAGMQVRVASPPGYALSEVDVDRITALGVAPELLDRPEEAVAGVDVVYTDVWTSMGQETEVEARRKAFEGYMVDERLMALAAENSIFLHCLPAHRGEEVSHEVLDGDRSRVWRQAENRMHAARGAVAWILGQV